MSWPRGRSADGGIDEIPLPIPGRLWLCGKHVVGPDASAAMARVDASSVLCFNERHEIEDRYPDYVEWLASGDTRAHWFPTPDLGTRATQEFISLVERWVDELRLGARLIAHCGAGVGRAGTFAVGVLLALDIDLDTALATVADHRPMAGPEAGGQRQLVEAIADHFRAGRP